MTKTQRLQTLRDKYVAQWATHSYKMEYDGYLSNHLLHALLALCELATKESHMDAYAARYVTKLAPVESTQGANGDAKKTLSVAEAQALRGKRERFDDLRAMYEQEIQLSSEDDAVKKHLPGLVGGLAGSLLHGIIQLGYAYRIGGELLVAEGLAYLHYSYLPFDGATKQGHERNEGIQKKAFTKETVLTLTRHLCGNAEMLARLHAHLKTPAITSCEQGDLQRRLMAFSSDRIVGNPELFATVAAVVDEYDLSNVDGVFALDFVIWLYVTLPPNSFVVLHAATSAWSLKQVEHLLATDDRTRAWKTWFRVTLSAYVAMEMPPPEDVSNAAIVAQLPTLPPWEDVIAQTLELEGDVDEHIYKLVQVAHEQEMASATIGSEYSPFLTVAEREFIMKKAALKVIRGDFQYGAPSHEA